jgi:hypothetical protein
VAAGVSISYDNLGPYGFSMVPSPKLGSDGSTSCTFICGRCRTGFVNTLSPQQVAQIMRGGVIKIICPTPGCGGINAQARRGGGRAIAGGIETPVPPGGALEATSNCPVCGELVQIRFPSGLTNPGKVRKAPQTCTKGHKWNVTIGVRDRPSA